MTCTDNVCGTGIALPGGPGSPGSPPGPGDPLGGMALTANAVYGGIQLAWTYPSINAHAVAHFIIYRSTDSDINNASELGVISGNRFLDTIGEEATYYYWIRVVSIYGTQGDLVGPASATARDRGADTIDDIQGRIVDGVLDTALRQDIARITLNYQELMAEIGNRVAGNAALSAALAELQNGLEESVALVNTEITTRQEGDSALASQVQIIAAANTANASAIIEERTARVSKDEALTTQYNAVLAATNNNAAAITNETTARTTADSALANQVSTVQTTLGDQIASVQVGAQTQINTLNGKVTDIGALWTARLSVEGLVGGFGVYNNGQYVEAGFDVDTFWIGRTNANRRKPFVINNGITYIEDAMIRNAAIDTLKIAGGAVTSMAYGSGSGSVSASGRTVIASCLVSMPSGGSGVVVTGTLSFTAATTTDAYFRLERRGSGQIQAGFTWAACEGGWYQSAAVTGWDSPGAGNHWYDLVAESPPSGPNANKPFHCQFASITATGGKR